MEVSKGDSTDFEVRVGRWLTDHHFFGGSERCENQTEVLAGGKVVPRFPNPNDKQISDFNNRRACSAVPNQGPMRIIAERLVYDYLLLTRTSDVACSINSLDIMDPRNDDFIYGDLVTNKEVERIEEVDSQLFGLTSQLAKNGLPAVQTNLLVVKISALQKERVQLKSIIDRDQASSMNLAKKEFNTIVNKSQSRKKSPLEGINIRPYPKDRKSTDGTALAKAIVTDVARKMALIRNIEIEQLKLAQQYDKMSRPPIPTAYGMLGMLKDLESADKIVNPVERERAKREANLKIDSYKKEVSMSANERQKGKDLFQAKFDYLSLAKSDILAQIPYITHSRMAEWVKTEFLPFEGISEANMYNFSSSGSGTFGVKVEPRKPLDEKKFIEEALSLSPRSFVNSVVKPLKADLTSDLSRYREQLRIRERRGSFENRFNGELAANASTQQLNLGNLGADISLFNFFICQGQRDYVEGLGKIDGTINVAVALAPLPPMFKIMRLKGMVSAGRITEAVAARYIRTYKLQQLGFKLGIPGLAKIAEDMGTYDPIPARTVEYDTCITQPVGSDMLDVKKETLDNNFDSLKQKLRSRTINFISGMPGTRFDSLNSETLK